MNQYNLEIGGMTINLQSTNEGFVRIISQKYKEFRSGNENGNGSFKVLMNTRGFKAQVNIAEEIGETSKNHRFTKKNETSMNLRFTKGNENTQKGFSGENARRGFSGEAPINLPLTKGYENLKQGLSEEKTEDIDPYTESWVDVQYNNSNRKFFIKRPDLSAEIDTERHSASVTNHEALYSFDSFLRILYSILLVPENGFLLHAASIMKNGAGYIFMGGSGAGKSTIAGLCSGKSTILSDEISLIKKIDGQYILYSTPFWGEQEIGGGNTHCPLNKIYSINKAEKTAVCQLDKKEAIMRVMENILYFAREPFLTEALFKNCLNMIEELPIYRLDFKNDESFFKLII